MDLSTGKQFAKLNDELKQSNFAQNIKKNQDLGSSQNNFDKTNESDKHSKGEKKKKKTQVGSFEKELNECNKCKRKFVNLKLHHTSGNCFQKETNTILPESISNKNCKPSEKSCPPIKCSKNAVKNGTYSEKLSSVKDTNTISEPLNIACKGCSKLFKRLLVHLNSKNGLECKSFYSPEELQKPNKWKAYYKKNKEKILEMKKEYQKKNSEQLKANRKRHYDENSEQLKETKKRHYDANSEQHKSSRKSHYDENSEQLKATKKRHYDNRTGLLGSTAGSPDRVVQEDPGHSSRRGSISRAMLLL